MSDRCYMQVACRRQDAQRFTDIGFEPHTKQGPDSPSITMIDEEADYGHDGELPDDVPWVGKSSPGGNYGASRYACDGKELVEVESGFNNYGYVVEWDTTLNEPVDSSLAEIRHFMDVRERAREMLGI